MENYITICKIDSPTEFAVWLRKLKQGLCINLESILKSRDNLEPIIQSEESEKEKDKHRILTHIYGI